MRAQVRQISAPRALTPSLAPLGFWAVPLGPPCCWDLGDSPAALWAQGSYTAKAFSPKPCWVCLLQHVNVAQGCTSENDLLTCLTLLCFGSCPGAVLESSGLGEQQLDSFQMKPNQMCSRNAPHAPQALLGVQATASAQRFSGV